MSAQTDEPHFMPGPQRPNRRHDLPPLLGRSRDKPVEHASAEIAPVQGYVDDEHEADNAVPCRDHRAISSPRLATASSPRLATTSSSGPWPISRPTRKRKSRPSTKYRPIKPINVKMVLPLLTTVL